MEMRYCPNCRKMTGHKRRVGVGTILGAAVTAGISVAAVPFYPTRCIICGDASASDSPSQSSVYVNAIKLEEDILSGGYSRKSILQRHGIELDYLTDFCQRMTLRSKWSQTDCDRFLEIKHEQTKACPFCAETIKEQAIVCRYCGRDLKPGEQQ